MTYQRCCQQTVEGAVTGPKHLTCGPLGRIDDTNSGRDAEDDERGTRQQVSEPTGGGGTETVTEASDDTVQPDWEALDVVDDLMAVQQERARKASGQVLEITVDSGAAEVVAPPTFAAGYATRPSAGSRSGARYRTASGNLISNQGEKRITMTTEEGETRTMTCQIADATKPLASAGRITSKGHRIVFDDDDAYILHKATGCRIKLYKNGNVFIMKVRIVDPEEASDERRPSVE